MLLISPHTVAVRRPRLTVVLWAIVILLATWGLGDLRLRTDGFALTPRNSPEVQRDKAIRETFLLRDRMMIILEPPQPGGVFCPEALRIVRDLTMSIKQLPGVAADDVISLATEPSGRVRTGPVSFPPLLDPLPTTEGEVEQARADITALRLHTGKIISRESEVRGHVWPYRAAAILVGVTDPGCCRSLVDSIRNLCARLLPDGYHLHIVGGPVAEALLGDYILSDLGRLLPATMLIMGLLFYWLFGSLRFVLVIFAEIAACLVITFGIMGHSQIPVTIAMGVLPLIIIPIIVADEIHIFCDLRRAADRVSTPWKQIVVEAFDSNWTPVVKTGITTAVSSLVFALGPVEAISHFGIFLFLATIVCTLWTLTMTPVLLARGVPLLPSRSRYRVIPFACSCSLWAAKNPRMALASIFLPVVCLAVAGLREIRIEDSWANGFAPESDFRRSMDRAESLFDGTHLLHIVFDTRSGNGADKKRFGDHDKSADRLLEPQVIDALGRFESHLQATIGRGSGGIVGAYQQLVTTRFIRSGGMESERRPGSTTQENRDLMKLLETIRGPKRLLETFDADRQQALITVFLRGASYSSVEDLLKQLKDYETSNLSPLGIRLGFAGDIMISQAIVKAVTFSELWSIFGSLVALFLVISWMEKSAKTGLLCSVPSAIAVTLNLALIGLLGIPLGVASSMFSGISFGIGVDTSIHFMEALHRTGKRGAEAVSLTLPRISSAISSEAIVLLCGFSVLYASSAPANRCLGMILASTFISCSFVTLVFLTVVFTISARPVTASSSR